jgi:hypothetical protein
MHSSVLCTNSHIDKVATKIVCGLKRPRKMKRYFTSRESQAICFSIAVLALKVNFLIQSVFVWYIVFMMNSFFLTSEAGTRQLKPKIAPTANKQIFWESCMGGT